MPQWVRASTRWSIYLRDGLRCIYCGVTLESLLEERSENFLTLDHVRARTKAGGHGPHNLVTCCYECNVTKGRKTISAYARELNISPSTLRWRTSKATLKDAERYREAARLLLGQVPGFKPHQKVVDHDWLVKKQWGSGVELEYWEHLKKQEALWCPECNAPLNPFSGHYEPPAEEPIPF